MTLSELIKLDFQNCSCGRVHKSCLDDVIIKRNAIACLPEVLCKYNAKKVFIISDKNTYKAAGEQVCKYLAESKTDFTSYVIPSHAPKPDESSVGSVIMHYDTSCDVIVAVGSGVINDLGKILACVADKPYMIVATAPSVDGYASSTSSMDRDGLKISLNSKCPNVIIGDLDILKNAPLKMLKAGLGDMLAKYTAICEWRIGNTVTGEYYCEYVASLVRYAANECIKNAKGLLSRDEAAVKAVFEGLVISGLAMNFAGISRPASGVEHYFSHLWDMRSLEFNAPSELHGLQCASGFLSATRVYEKLKHRTPNQSKALAYTASFNVEKWNAALRDNWGRGADTMISVGEKELRYNLDAHKKRLDSILTCWDSIITVINEELLPLEEAEALFKELDMPDCASELCRDKEFLKLVFKATKDIRSKYILSTLLWDLGELDNESLLSSL